MHRHLKKQARRVRKAQRRIEWKERRKQIRCFWSWPIRHEFVNFGSEYDPEFKCVSCEMPQPNIPRSAVYRTR